MPIDLDSPAYEVVEALWKNDTSHSRGDILTDQERRELLMGAVEPETYSPEPRPVECCSLCDGSGEIVAHPEPMECPSCFGTGEPVQELPPPESDLGDAIHMMGHTYSTLRENYQRLKAANDALADAMGYPGDRRVSITGRHAGKEQYIGVAER